MRRIRLLLPMRGTRAFHGGGNRSMQVGYSLLCEKATGIALPIWAFSRLLVEVQEPERAGSEAGGGRGLATMSQHQTEGSAAGHFLTRSAFTPPTRLPSSCSYAALWILF